MVTQLGVVSVALQLESGNRIAVTVPSSSTLWDLLMLASNEAGQILTYSAEHQTGLYMRAVVNFMNREVPIENNKPKFCDNTDNWKQKLANDYATTDGPRFWYCSAAVMALVVFNLDY